MELIKREEGIAKTAKRHFLQCGISKVSTERGSIRLNFSVSHFLPGGGAEMYASPTERAYFGLYGVLLIKDKQGNEFVLEPGDTLYLPPDEERSIEVLGNEPATMLVVIVKLK
jgi:quercetin dioxygenase-like cupin family protein